MRPLLKSNFAPCPNQEKGAKEQGFDYESVFISRRRFAAFAAVVLFGSKTADVANKRGNFICS